MSERKTAEIKFRCTESFKASVVAAADAANESLTEYLEAAARSRMTAPHDVAEMIDTTLRTLEPWRFPTSGQAVELDRTVFPDGESFLKSLDVGVHPESEQALALEGAIPIVPVEGLPPGAVAAVNLNLDAGVSACACRPWEFCTHKARA